MAIDLQVPAQMLENKKLFWVEKVLSLSEKDVCDIAGNTYAEFYGSLLKIFSGNNKEFNSEMKSIRNHFKDTLSLNYIIIAMIGAVLAYFIYTKTSKMGDRIFPIHTISKILYLSIWSIVLSACVFKNIKNLQNLKLENLKSFLIYSFLSVLIATVLSCIVFFLFIGICEIWFLLYPCLAISICFISFAENLKVSGLKGTRAIACAMGISIFFIIEYFFYDYIDKIVKKIRKAMKKLVIYIPFILLFVVLTASAEYLQIEALKSLFFSKSNTSKLSFAFRNILLNISSDLSKSFLFSLCISWTYNVIRNLNVFFVSSLLSNRLIQRKAKFLNALTNTFKSFSQICYASIFPGFFSSIKSTLKFIAAVLEQIDLSIVSYVANLILCFLIYLIDGIELFFGNYNQVYFVILAYEKSLNNGKVCENGKIIKTSLEIDSKMKDSIFHQHPEALLFSTPRFLRLIVKYQPSDIFSYIFARVNINVVLKPKIQKLFFPTYLFLQIFTEMILFIGASIILEKHHAISQNDESVNNTKTIENEKSNTFASDILEVKEFFN